MHLPVPVLPFEGVVAVIDVKVSRRVRDGCQRSDGVRWLARAGDPASGLTLEGRRPTVRRIWNSVPKKPMVRPRCARARIRFSSPRRSR